MRVVVADSSPLNYLTLIGSVEVLRQLYDTVVVPEQVIRELIDPAAPHEVRVWASTPPEWVSVRAVVVPETAMLHLDPGERAAIALAESEPDSLLLIDDAAGRLEATSVGRCRVDPDRRPAAGRVSALAAAGQRAAAAGSLVAEGRCRPDCRRQWGMIDTESPCSWTQASTP